MDVIKKRLRDTCDIKNHVSKEYRDFYNMIYSTMFVIETPQYMTDWLIEKCKHSIEENKYKIHEWFGKKIYINDIDVLDDIYIKKVNLSDITILNDTNCESIKSITEDIKNVNIKKVSHYVDDYLIYYKEIKMVKIPSCDSIVYIIHSSTIECVFDIIRVCKRIKKKYKIHIKEIIINPLHVLHNIYMKDDYYLIEYYENMFHILMKDRRVIIENIHYQEIIMYVQKMQTIMKRMKDKADVIYDFYDIKYYDSDMYDFIIQKFYNGIVPYEVANNSSRFHHEYKDTYRFNTVV